MKLRNHKKIRINAHHGKSSKPPHYKDMKYILRKIKVHKILNI